MVWTGSDHHTDLTGAKHPVFELSGELAPEAPVGIRAWIGQLWLRAYMLFSRSDKVEVGSQKRGREPALCKWGGQDQVGMEDTWGAMVKSYNGGDIV